MGGGSDTLPSCLAVVDGVGNGYNEQSSQRQGFWSDPGNHREKIDGERQE